MIYLWNQGPPSAPEGMYDRCEGCWRKKSGHYIYSLTREPNFFWEHSIRENHDWYLCEECYLKIVW